jgi:hypothetical protein
MKGTVPANVRATLLGRSMTNAWLILFAIATGFTASGIMANLYRLLGFKAESKNERMLRAAVMVIAGPCVLIENAVSGVMSKRWRLAYFWIGAAGAAYWSLAIGLFVLDVALKI